MFWLLTIARYLLTAAGAFVLSIVLSFLSILPFTAKNSDSRGGGFLWLMAFFAEFCVLLPACLSVTAERIQRKVERRPFKWSAAAGRFPLAAGMLVAPIYSIFWVWQYMESWRPVHYFAKEIALDCLSLACVFLALRIRRRPRLHPTG